MLRGSFQKRPNRKIIFAVLLPALCISFVLAACSFLFRIRSYKVTETYLFISADGAKSFLTVDLPVSYGYQEIGEIKVRNADEYYFEEMGGYQVLHASVTGESTGKTVEIEYTVTLHAGERTWDMETRDEYLQPSENIDSDNESIIEAVRPPVVENDDYRTAKNISAFVSKTVKTDTKQRINHTTQPASKILEEKTGVCTDCANLMTAMLRAAGIPARRVSGLAFNRLTEAADWTHPASSHAWVEFYAGGKWHFADPTWGNPYFDRPDGFHLSYGEEVVDISTDEFKARFEKFQKSVEDDGCKIIGAMTAPLKYTAWSEDHDAWVIPRAEATKTMGTDTERQ